MNSKELFETLDKLPVDEARALVNQYVCKFWQLPAGSYFNLLNDNFCHTYRKIAAELGPGGIVNKNAVNVTTGQVVWVADSVTCVKEAESEQHAKDQVEDDPNDWGYRPGDDDEGDGHIARFDEFGFRIMAFSA